MGSLEENQIMGHLFLRGFLLGLILAGLLLGCHKQMVQQKVPPDPLLISKKPVEGHMDSSVGQR
jgi:hypothetical protein